MKADIHPRFFNATVTCSCGHTFQTARPGRNCAWKYAASATPFTPGNSE